MLSKRRKSCGTTHDSDIRNVAVLVGACAILAICCAVIWVVLLCIEYWYISAPVLICIGYAWYKTRQIQKIPVPQSKHIETSEETKTQHGTKIISTTEDYHESPGILHILITSLIQRI